MSVYFAAEIAADQLEVGLLRALDAIGRRNRVLVVPPDFTRYHSRSGELTRCAWDYYGDRLTHILPALGTHTAMTDRQIEIMFGGVPRHLFHAHNWRSDLATLGEVPASVIREESEGQLEFSLLVRVNRLLVEGGFDLILSIGQVVPHEVAGMAGHSKNLIIGTGGSENINQTHYLGAVYGMERIMGRADNPVRRVLNYAADRSLRQLPIVYVLTVIGRDGRCGLFVGDDLECFEQAARLSQRLNINLLDRPLQRAVVYLDAAEYRSTWLGNKAIYRTRMAMADGGELIVLAPGVKRFGEDAGIDALIRKYGYSGTAAVRDAVGRDPFLAANLSAAAHLIHGSSEGRFHVTYCCEHLSKEEIEGVGLRYRPLAPMMKQYDPAKLTPGFHAAGGDEFYFVPNPAEGLWAHRDRFSAIQEETDTWQLTHKH